MSSKDAEPEDAGSFPLYTDWASVSEHTFNSYLEASNAVLATVGFSESARSSSRADTSTGSARPGNIAYDRAGWVFERSTDDYDSLGVGEYVRFSKLLTEPGVSAFARTSGDTNRLHLDSEFAEQTMFGRRIVHGTLVAGTISAALARFPGVTVYLSQDLEFHNPVDIGTTVTAACEIVEELDADKYRVHTTVHDSAETKVIDGEALVLINEPPEGTDGDVFSTPGEVHSADDGR